MMSIKSNLFYSILFASVLGGAGLGYVAAPTNNSAETIIRQAQEMAKECQPEKRLPKGPIYNSRAKEY